MKKLLVAVVGFSSLFCSGAALADGNTPEALALDRAARVARPEGRPVRTPESLKLAGLGNCRVRPLLNSTFQSVVTCEK